MENMTFTTNIAGREYEVYNGTSELGSDKVLVKEVATGNTFVIKENGTYSSRVGARKAIGKYLDKQCGILQEEEAVAEQYMTEVEEAPVEEATVSEEYVDIENLVDFYEYAEEIYAESEEAEEPAQENLIEEVIVRTISDVIYRNLPKYVQKAIDYCEYADGVYKIHVNTEFGSKQIEAAKWADASAIVKKYCKTGA